LLILLLWSPTQSQDGPSSALFTPTKPSTRPLRSFLNREIWPGYINYGKHIFETAPVSALSYELYDRMGYHIFRGYPLIRWTETRSDSTGLQVSDVMRKVYFFRFFGSLVVSQDTYKGWKVGLILGDNIRTTLTPLTLQLPRWQGIRIDGESPRHGFTVLFTRGSAGRFSTLHHQREWSPVLFYGGRWYSKIMEAVTLGATFLNQHQVDVESGRGSFLHGTLPYQMEVPERIYVRITSDAPSDGTVAGAYEVRLKLYALKDGKRVTLTSYPTMGPGAKYEPSLVPSISGRRVGDHWEAKGGESIEFTFDIPDVDAVERAVFEARVSGDYRISVRQVHRFLNTSGKFPAWEERSWPSPSNPKRYYGSPNYPLDFKPSEDIPYYTVARALGNPGLDEVRRVRFEYGMPVGQSFLGADLKVESEEVLARGEIVYNFREARFPFANDSLGIMGKLSQKGSWAYYLGVVKPLNIGPLNIELGGELFRMDPDYGGSYDSRRGGMVFFTDRGGSKGADAVTQEFPLVADNDDGDIWADDTLNDEGRFQRAYPYRYSGGDAYSGVYPGLDMDGDNSPDTDRDRNGVPDWTQPFLLYNSDPADFVYGLDFNNNGYVDFRENDDHPDYPIRRDQRGVHAYVAFLRPLPWLERASVGGYSVREIAGWGRAEAVYALMQAVWFPHRSLDLELEDDVKYVMDTIRDDVYEFSVGPNDSMNIASPLYPPPRDPLTMKKSLVNTSSLKIDYRPLRSLRFMTHFVHFINRQYAYTDPCGVTQEDDLFTKLSLVSRAEYTFSWSRFRLWAGAKYMLKREERRSARRPTSSISFFAPMIKVSFEFMPDCTFQWGISGFGRLPMRFVDHVDRDNSYRERTMVFLVNARTDKYLGSFPVNISFGLQLHSIDYDSEEGLKDSDTFGIFMDLMGEI